MDEYSNIAMYYEKLLSRFLYPIRKNICTFLQYHKHKKILDVCCGTGEQLAMLESEKMQLVGVDLSGAMLKEASSRKNIRFLQLDATEMDFPSQSFDAVILTFSLHEKSELDREVIFKASWDLVRQGGHLIICDYCQVNPSLMGGILEKICIPLIERSAGSNHYQCFTNWIEKGALEGFLLHFNERTDIISTHLFGTAMLCSIQKESQLNKAFYEINLLE